jgi:hypothetical protein
MKLVNIILTCRSLIAYNAESKILETVKTNGVLYTQSTPRYGMISWHVIYFSNGWLELGRRCD